MADFGCGELAQVVGTQRADQITVQQGFDQMDGPELLGGRFQSVQESAFVKAVDRGVKIPIHRVGWGQPDIGAQDAAVDFQGLFQQVEGKGE